MDILFATAAVVLVIGLCVEDSWAKAIGLGLAALFSPLLLAAGAIYLTFTSIFKPLK